MTAPVGEVVVVVATPLVSPLDPDGVLGSGVVVETLVAAESAA